MLGLAVFWLAVQAWLFFYGPGTHLMASEFGVRHGRDTVRYLDAAALLLSGKIPAGLATRYMGYNLFVASILWVGLSHTAIVLIQAALTSVAAYCLYRVALKLYGSRTGILAAILYIGYAEIHAWNFYILTESLFTSMLIISLFLMMERREWWWMATALPVVLFTTFIRPHGVILLPSVGIYILYSLWKTRSYKALFGVACIFLLATPVAFKVVSHFLTFSDIAQKYADGIIISEYKSFHLTMPGVLPENIALAQNGFYQIFIFFIDKPGFLLKLAWMKLWYFFLHARPYYSSLHNYFLLLTLMPSYALATWGLAARADHPEGKLLLVLVCFFQALVVSLTMADWSGRHLVPILPIIFVFSAKGFWRLWDAGRKVYLKTDGAGPKKLES